MMKTHSETLLSDDTASSLAASSDEAATLVGVRPDDEPSAIVDAVDAFVFAWQSGNRPAQSVLDPEDAPYSLGSLWGQQLVRQFRWEWRMVTFHEHGNSVAPGVLSPDRSLAIYPIHFLMGCLRDSGVDATIMLSFNMLKAGNLGETTPGSYVNLMDGVHRIVPRIATPPNKPWWKRVIG